MLMETSTILTRKLYITSSKQNARRSACNTGWFAELLHEVGWLQAMQNREDPACFKGERKRSEILHMHFGKLSQNKKFLFYFIIWPKILPRNTFLWHKASGRLHHGIGHDLISTVGWLMKPWPRSQQTMEWDNEQPPFLLIKWVGSSNGRNLRQTYLRGRFFF